MAPRLLDPCWYPGRRAQMAGWGLLLLVTAGSQAFANAQTPGGSPTSTVGAEMGGQNPSDAPQTSLPAQWRSFTIPKPSSEIPPPSEADPRLNDARFQPRLPSRTDFLRSTVGLGYVLQNDWGIELGTSGRIAGFETNLNSFLTVGPAGVEVPVARLSVVAPKSAWSAEGGDLLTELRGLARGVRFSWKAGETHRPTVSVYLPSERLRDSSTAIGFSDEVRLFSRIVAGGEATTDGSYLLRAAYLHKRFDLQASHRRVRRDDPGDDTALMASYDVGRGIVMRAGVRTFDTAGERGHSRLMSIRVPIANLFDLTLEDNRGTSGGADDVSHAVNVQVLRGPVRLNQRYQWGDTEYLTSGGPFGIQRQQLQTSASFSPWRWATFSPQTVTQWLPDGQARQWQELQSDLTLSRTTRLQLHTSFPDLRDEARFRSRLEQKLPGQFTLLVDYGRVSPYQPTVLRDVTEPRMSVMVRKTWRTATPATGTEISGRLLDELGNPVAGAGVRLGPYLVFTDAGGRYVFDKVPSGDFQLRVANELLPAEYASDGVSHQLSVSGHGRLTVDLVAIPLNSICGRVYLDSNQNGKFDAGEGRAGVVVRAADRVTATDADGAYGFYNLAPGTYTVELDIDSLAATYVAVSRSAVSVQLEGGRPAVGIDFELAAKTRPIILQKVSK